MHRTRARKPGPYIGYPATGYPATVVVTGASSGIGRACALALARSGFHVFAGVRKEEDARALEGDAPGIA